MATIAELEVKLTTELSQVKKDLAKFRSDLDNADTHTGKISKSMKSAFKAVAVAVAAIGIGKFTKEVVRLASEAEETRNKFNVVFSDIRDEANKAAANLNLNFGLSRQASEDLLSGVGDLLTGFGLTQEKALELADAAAQLGTDLASFTNYAGGAQGATEALAAAMLGERERVKSLGIAITETDLKKFAAEQGKNWELMDRGARATLTLDMALRQSKNAIGDFARSQDSFANVQRRVNARLEDMGAKIGAELLPVLSDLGLAFLRASEDGGVIVRILDFVISSVKIATKQVTRFLNVFSFKAKEKEIKKIDEELNLLNAEFRALRDEGIADRKELEENLAAQDKLLKKRKQLVIGLDELSNANLNLRDEMKKELGLIGDIIRGREYEREKHLESEKAKTKNTKKEAEKRTKIEIEETKKAAWAILGVTQNLVSQLGSLYSIYYSNVSMQIDNDKYEAVTAIDEKYEQQKEAIENNITDEEERAEKLKALDEQYARDKNELDKEYDKKERKLKREAAKTAKKFAIADTLLSIPQMALQAWRAVVMPHLPWTLIAGGIAAAAATALGFAKLKLIKDQPLPAAAAGMFANRPAIFGEAGPEVAVPLSGDQGRNAIKELAAGMLDVMSQMIDTRATVGTPALAADTGGGNVYLDGTLVGKWISRASNNGGFTLNKRVII